METAAWIIDETTAWIIDETTAWIIDETTAWIIDETTASLIDGDCCLDDGSSYLHIERYHLDVDFDGSVKKRSFYTG
jgi:hypothetical protein